MDTWMLWAVVAVVLVIIEIFTPSFFFVCLAVGALCGSVGAALGLGLSWQLVLFAAGSTVAFVFVRPVMVKYFLKKDKLKTGVDALVGRVARVSEAIDPAAGSGRVALDGDDWRAVAADGECSAVGESVVVTRVESATVYVKRRHDRCYSLFKFFDRGDFCLRARDFFRRHEAHSGSYVTSVGWKKRRPKTKRTKVESFKQTLTNSNQIIILWKL